MHAEFFVVRTAGGSWESMGPVAWLIEINKPNHTLAAYGVREGDRRVLWDCDMARAGDDVFIVKGTPPIRYAPQ